MTWSVRFLTLAIMSVHVSYHPHSVYLELNSSTDNSSCIRIVKEMELFDLQFFNFNYTDTALMQMCTGAMIPNV